MPASRSARSRQADNSRSLYADESEEDTEEEATPQVARTTSARRRRSEIGDKGHSDEPNLKRSRTIVNDDAAEKRRRRQSTRVGEPATSGGVDGEGGDDTPRAAMHPRPGRQLDIVDTAVDITPDSVDEWMKMHMDGVRDL